MEPAAVATARDLALILLVIEAAILALPFLIVPFLVLRYLPRISAPLRPALREVRHRTARAERVTKSVMTVATQPLIWIIAAIAGLRGVLGYVARRR